jgi:5-methylthioadenosine/S-adenosylhomocysteine deaminase
MAPTLVIVNATLLSEAGRPLQDGRFVAIEGGFIGPVGSMDHFPGPGDAQVIDARSRLLMPGLVNGHTHGAMTLFRGFADDLALQDWLRNHIFPAEAAHVNREMAYWCTKLAAAEMIRSGTTCVADAYFHSSEAARAFNDAGMRAVVGHGIVDFPAPSVPDPAKNIETVARFVDNWLGTSPLITPAVFPHAPYTCSPATLKKAKELADAKGVRLLIHIAETRSEMTQITDPRGSSPIKHLHALGLIDDNCTCIHAVWADEHDLDLLAASDASVVTCPQSNAKLASGIAPVRGMLARGITVGIGTDGCASNNSLDMFREMDMLAKLQKLAGADPTALPAAEVLGCATSSGAEAVGLDGLGAIKTGGRADLILVDLSTPHLNPLYSADLLVYSGGAGNVDSVIIDGRLIMQDRVILSFDIGEAAARVRDLAARVGAAL